VLWPNTWNAMQGSMAVFITSKPAVRMGDKTRHCGGIGSVIEGSQNVIVGGAPGMGSPGPASSGVRARARPVGCGDDHRVRSGHPDHRSGLPFLDRSGAQVQGAAGASCNSRSRSSDILT